MSGKITDFDQCETYKNSIAAKEDSSVDTKETTRSETEARRSIVCRTAGRGRAQYGKCIVFRERERKRRRCGRCIALAVTAAVAQ